MSAHVAVEYRVSKSITMRGRFLDRGGTPVLFVHGLGCSSDYWNSIWASQELSEFTLLALDLVGFGASDKPSKFDYRLEQQADALLEVINILDKPVQLVGHSMGGSVCTLLLPREEVVAFANIEGNLAKFAPGSISKKAAAQTEEEFAATGFERLRRRFPDWPKGYASMSQCNARSFHRASCSLVKWTESRMLLEKFIAADKPKCYIHGDESADFDTLNDLGGVRTVCVPTSGHFPMVDNPQQFCKTLAAFLSDNN